MPCRAASLFPSFCLCAFSYYHHAFQPFTTSARLLTYARRAAPLHTHYARCHFHIIPHLPRYASPPTALAHHVAGGSYLPTVIASSLHTLPPASSPPINSASYAYLYLAHFTHRYCSIRCLIPLYILPERWTMTSSRCRAVLRSFTHAPRYTHPPPLLHHTLPPTTPLRTHSCRTLPRTFSHFAWPGL